MQMTHEFRHSRHVQTILNLVLNTTVRRPVLQLRRERLVIIQYLSLVQFIRFPSLLGERINPTGYCLIDRESEVPTA